MFIFIIYHIHTLIDGMGGLSAALETGGGVFETMRWHIRLIMLIILMIIIVVNIGNNSHDNNPWQYMSETAKQKTGNGQEQARRQNGEAAKRKAAETDGTTIHKYK